MTQSHGEIVTLKNFPSQCGESSIFDDFGGPKMESKAIEQKTFVSRSCSIALEHYC